MSDRLDAFYEKVDDAYDSLSGDEYNSDELLFLTMKSLGVIADSFRTDCTNSVDVEAQCAYISAACALLATNYTSDKKVEDSSGSSFFFVYKHHSENMTKVLKAWISSSIPQGFSYIKNCGKDKRGMYLIGLLDENEQAQGFVLCPTAFIGNDCLDFLEAEYQNRASLLLFDDLSYKFN